MFCTNCGKTLEEGELICSACGTPVESQSVEPGTQTVEPDSQTIEPEVQVVEPAKPVGKPVKAVVFGVIYPVVLFIMAFYNMIRSIVIYLKAGLTFESYAKVLFINLGLSLAVVGLGIIPIILVLIIRRKKLTTMSLKDIFAECILIVGIGATNVLCNIILNADLAALGTSALSAVSISNTIVALFSLSGIIGCIAVATYLLGRSRAMIASIILPVAGLVGEAFLAVILSAGTPGILTGLYGISGEIASYAIGYVRISIWLALFVNLALLAFAWAWGNSKATHAFWPFISSLAAVGGCIIFALSLTALAGFLMLKAYLGVNVLVLGRAGMALGLLVGAAVTLVIMLKFKNKAE